MAASGDIVDLIKHDHEELEEAYAKYKAAHGGGDEEEAGKWFHEFVWEISRHSVSEEMVLYPLLDCLPSPRGKDLADQSRQEHQHSKEMLEKLMAIKDAPAEFEKTMDAMMADLRQHIQKEEAEDLALVKSHLSDRDREAAGAKFQLGKKLWAHAPPRRRAQQQDRAGVRPGAVAQARRQAQGRLHLIPQAHLKLSSPIFSTCAQPLATRCNQYQYKRACNCCKWRLEFFPDLDVRVWKQSCF